MKKDGVGGGNTVTGLRFENKADFLTLISKEPGYSIRDSQTVGTDILFKEKVCATCFKKHEFYKFLDHRKVDHKNIISRKLLPDNAILVLPKTLFIIEVKYQQSEGSVDEKLQTCDFKRKQYKKLVSPLGLSVKYVYVLNEWFEDPKYKDTLDYIHSVNCHYKFKELPIECLGLPAGQENELENTS